MNNFDFDEIPQQGFVYYESDTNVFIEEYLVCNGQIECEHAKDVVNFDYRSIDFFNEQINIRYKRSCNDKIFIQKFCSDDIEEKDPLLYMSEELILEEKYRFDNYQKIKIINRFYFDKNNVIHLKNYRLVTLLNEK